MEYDNKKAAQNRLNFIYKNRQNLHDLSIVELKNRVSALEYAKKINNMDSEFLNIDNDKIDNAIAEIKKVIQEKYRRGEDIFDSKKNSILPSLKDSHPKLFGIVRKMEFSDFLMIITLIILLIIVLK
jgi:hypothetical protein